MARHYQDVTPERLDEVFRRRQAGQRFEQIGRELGVTRQRAHQLYREAQRRPHNPGPGYDPKREAREAFAARLRWAWPTPLEELP